MGELDSTDSQLSGKTLGTFTLQRLLGRGGMGAVYLAQQSRPRRTVAVKVLLPELFQNSTGFNEFLVRFRREADAIAALDHINIMPIYEYGEQDRLAYLVMPYVAGGTLRDIVGERGKLPISETTTIVEQIAAALDYAHQHGIIHRDLKPGNILFHADGRLLLTDFGIAKVLGDPATANVAAMQTLTMAGMIIGTPEYLSPEQAAGAPIDNRSDVYALGIVLFQLLSGRVPFTGTTPVAVAIKHATQAPPSLSQLNPAIPPGVEHVIVKALAKKPEQRYATAGELARELRTAVTDYQPAVKISLLSTDETMLDTIPPVRGKQIYESTVATNRPNDELTVATNRPSDELTVATIRPNDELTVATNRPGDEPAVATNRQPRKRQGGRLPLWLALLSGILVVLLILGGSALYLHWLPGGNQQPSGSTKNQAASTPTPKSSATVSHPQTTLPSPSIAVGKLLYGTSLPLCDGQSSLWNTNPSLQSTCDAADTRLTNTNAGQVEGEILKTFPGNAPIPNDYVLEVQVKPVSASSGAFGIFFRTQSGANHQGGFSFMVQPSGQWNGNSIDDTTGQATSLFGLQGTALSSTGFTTIDIVVNGNIFQLYFNGARQGGISSSSYPTGNLGLAVGGGSDVLFKNLAIYALP